MKPVQIAGIGIGALALSLTLPAQAVIVADDFSSNTLGQYQTPAGRSAFSWTNTNGVGGVSGAVEGTAGNNIYVAVFGTPVSTGFADTPTLVSSIYFQTESSVGNSGTAGLSFATDVNSLLNDATAGNGSMGVEVRDSGGDWILRFRGNDTGAFEVIPDGTADKVTDTWLQLTFTATWVADQTFDVFAELRNWGADGLTGGDVILSGGGQIVLPADDVPGTTSTIVGDDDLFAGFMIRANRAELADNFVVDVPEPASLALMGLGGLVMLRRRG